MSLSISKRASAIGPGFSEITPYNGTNKKSTNTFSEYHIHPDLPIANKTNLDFSTFVYTGFI